MTRKKKPVKSHRNPIRRVPGGEVASKKSRILLFAVVAGVLLLAAALFLLNYVHGPDKLIPASAPKNAKTSSASLTANTVAFESKWIDISKFQYRPESIQPNVLYHYIKTNPDGSNPENVAVYVAANDRLEVFKYRNPGTLAGFVIGWMDWKTFSLQKLESYQVSAPNEQKLVATFDFEKNTGTGTVRLLASDDIPPQTVRIEHLPFHIYNFDFASLNFAFRHLIDPKSSFVIGVPDFVFQNNQWNFVYRGTVEIRYANDEMLHGVGCRKYSIDGPGLENRAGKIWVHAASGHIERMQIDLPDNPDWDHFFLDLKRIQHLSAKDWRKFREVHFSSSLPISD